MKSLEKKYHKIFNTFLCILPVSFIFMKLSNVIVILFVIFNLLFFKKLVLKKQKLVLYIIGALPLLLDLLFFWNNSSFMQAIKATEKHLLFLIFPFIVISYDKKINLHKLLKVYVALMLLVLSILFFRYIILFPENMLKYLKGVHLWEMGYHFTNSFNNHAPALNMHLAFVSVASFFLLIRLKTKNKWLRLTYLLQYIFSLFFLLYVNTRVAVVTAVLGYALVLLFWFFKSVNKKLAIKRILILLTLLTFGITSFVFMFPYSIEKFTKKSFDNMDMIGRLDEFDNPEDKVFSALVTRVSIWKSALELSNNKLLIGYGAADAKMKLFEYYKETNQEFLYKYKFPVHNQFIDFLLKYGLLGVLSVFVFIWCIGYLGYAQKSPIILFFCILFFLSNLTDDFLILYSGISFSSFWFSIFANQNKLSLNEKN